MLVKIAGWLHSAAFLFILKAEKLIMEERAIMKKAYSWGKLLPGILLLSLLPVFCRLQIVDTGLSEYPWFTSEARQGDVFLYWKGILFLILVAGMLVILILRRNSLLLEGLWIPLGLYLVLAILSTALSDEKRFSLQGMFGSYETIFILIGYGITAFYFAQIWIGEKERVIFLICLLIGAGVQGVLGLSQILGRDFWNTGLGQWILASGGEKLLFRFGGIEGHQVYMGSYHPNYAAVYCILMIPILTAGFFYFQKRWEKTAAGIVCAVMLICLVGTGSRAGLLTLAVMGSFALCILVKGMRKKGIILLIFAGILGCMAAGYSLYSGNAIGDYLRQGLFPPKETYALKEVRVEEEGVRIFYKEQEILLDAWKNTEGSVVFHAENGEGERCQLSLDEKTNRYRVKPIRLLQFEIYVENNIIYLVMYYKGIPWFFAKPMEGGQFQYLTVYGKTDVITKAPSVLFEGRERFLSNRGYIWSRTLPLLKQTLLVGTGPDTFAVQFPQNDYVMKANLGEDMLVQAVTKPHNMYLQTAVQTGVLSLIALLVFFIWSMIRMNKRRKLMKRGKCLYAGLLFATVSYFCMGIANDSMIVTAPLFFACLGMGIGVAENDKK